MEGKKEFWHLIRYGHLLCQTKPGLLVETCAWKHEVIHRPCTVLCASALEVVTLSSSLVNMNNIGIWTIL